MDIVRLKRFAYPLVALLIGAGMISWMVANPASSLDASQLAEPDPLLGAPAIATLKPQQGIYAPQLQLYSQVKSSQQVVITSPVATDIEQVLVSEGDWVQKDQQLVVINSASLQRQLDQLQSRQQDIRARQALEKQQYENNVAALPVEKNLVEIAQRSVDRLKNLMLQNLSSSVDLENAERALQNQILVKQSRELAINRFSLVNRQYVAQLAEIESQSEQLASQLTDAKIYAPFSGRVSRVQVQNATRVVAGSPLLTLVGQGQQELEAWVAVSALHGIDQQMQLQGYVENDANVIPVRLKNLDPAADAGSLRLFFSPEKYEPTLTINRYYRLWLDLPEVNAIALPESAVYGNSYVYSVENNALIRNPVTVVGERFYQGQLWRLVQSDSVNQKLILVTRLQNAAQGLAVRSVQSLNNLPAQ